MNAASQYPVHVQEKIDQAFVSLQAAGLALFRANVLTQQALAAQGEADAARRQAVEDEEAARHAIAAYLAELN
jgi:hypothetical protein